MDLEELRAKHRILQKASDTTLSNMSIIADESERVADTAHNSLCILDDLDKEFEQKTGLNGADISFLFFATAMQCARIFLVNKLTGIENAGQGNKIENTIHDIQNKILKNFDNGERLKPTKYNAPLNQILFGRGVPYDATKYGSDELKKNWDF